MDQGPDLAFFLYGKSKGMGEGPRHRMRMSFVQPLSNRHDRISSAKMAVLGIAGDMSYPNVLALGATLVLSYVVVTAVYRLYFHPLAKFPGPFWSRLTTFPAWWHSKNQDRHLWLLNLQEQYGKYLSTSIVGNSQ